MVRRKTPSAAPSQRAAATDVKYDTTIVGVVGDIKHTDMRTQLGPAVYRPYLQEKHPTGVTVYVQTTQSPETFAPAIRQTIHQLDPTLVVDGLRTMEEQIDRSASPMSARWHFSPSVSPCWP